MSNELSPQDRSAYRAALIKAGVPTRGKSDTGLFEAYNELVDIVEAGEAQAPEVVEQAKSDEVESEPKRLISATERGSMCHVLTMAGKECVNLDDPTLLKTYNEFMDRMNVVEPERPSDSELLAQLDQRLSVQNQALAMDEDQLTALIRKVLREQLTKILADLGG